jgi:hypothetical protein
MALTQTQVSQLYVAIFNRASEGDGNTYWQNTGLSFEDTATEMLNTADAQTYFGSSLDTDQAFVEHIYLNTFNKTYADDAEGIDFWVLALQTYSRGYVVSEIVTAATAAENAGDAQDQFLNRVAVSNYTAETLATVPSDYATSLAFDGDLVVTNDAATVTSAEASVDAIVAAGEELTLADAFANLATAETAVDDFLATLELDTNDDGDIDVALGDAVAADVATDLATAVTAYDTLATTDVENDSAALTAAKVAVYEQTLNEALTTAETALAEAQADAADLLAAYDAAVAADAAEFAAKDAIVEAYTSNTRSSADEAASATFVGAMLSYSSDITAAEASDDAGGDDDLYVVDSSSTGYDMYPNDYFGITSTTLGGSVELASYDADTDRVELTDVYTELGYATDTTDETELAEIALFLEYQSLDALTVAVAQANSVFDAYNAIIALEEATAAAEYTLGFLDIDTDADDELALVGAGFTATTPADADAPTEAEIAAEIAALEAEVTTTEAIATATLAAQTAAETAYETAEGYPVTIAADGTATINDGAVKALLEVNAGVVSAAAAYTSVSDLTSLIATVQARLDADTANTAADTALTDFNTLVTAFDTANDNNPLTDGLDALETAVTDAQADLDDWADAVANLAEAQANDDALTALQDAVTAAEDAFGDNDFGTPNDVDAVSEFGTAENDLFVAGTTDSSIYSFNLLGDDLLYVGTDVTYNSTEIGAGADQTLLADAGDVAVLEFFLEQNGADTDVIIETKAYGSETTDYTTITLVGVDVADLTVADGIISVA